MQMLNKQGFHVKPVFERKFQAVYVIESLSADLQKVLAK
jgi:hypothetical protein